MIARLWDVSVQASIFVFRVEAATSAEAMEKAAPMIEVHAVEAAKVAPVWITEAHDD